MPKAEKETKKDLTTMQQEIKRRNKVNPGTPTDVGLWSGSTDTKYRWASILSPVYALGFFSGLAMSVIYCKLVIILHSFNLVGQCSSKISKTLTGEMFFGSIPFPWRLLESAEGFTLVDSSTFKEALSKTEDFILVDELNTDYQPG